MIPNTAQVLGLFNLVVGLMLVASILLFVGGFVMYLIRLGTWPTYRDDAIVIMGWGVTVLFMLVVLLAIQQFLSRNILVAVSAAAFIIVLLVIYVVGKDILTQKPKKEDDRGA